MKKILALALVLVFALGMMVPVSAAKNKVTAVDETQFILDMSADDLNPGDTVTIDLFTLTKNNVVGGGGDTFGPFTLSEAIDVSKIGPLNSNNAADVPIFEAYCKSVFNVIKGTDVRIRHRAGTKVFDDYEYKYSVTTTSSGGFRFSMWLELNTIDPFISVDDVDYEIDVYFVVDGQRTDDIFYINITGNFANPVTEVFADSVEADTWQGQVIDAQEYVGKITLVGNKDEDVFAHVKMANGKKIYFVVNTDGDAKDEPIMDKYPSIEFAYTVLSVGLSGTSGNFIELSGVDEAYYVYGKNADGSLKYLGRGGELLPYSAKYYISSMKLDLDDDVIEDLPEEDDEVPSYNPSTGI